MESKCISEEPTTTFQADRSDNQTQVDKMAKELQDLIPKPLPLLDNGTIGVGGTDSGPKWGLLKARNQRYTPATKQEAQDESEVEDSSNGQQPEDEKIGGNVA